MYGFSVENNAHFMDINLCLINSLHSHPNMVTICICNVNVLKYPKNS